MLYFQDSRILNECSRMSWEVLESLEVVLQTIRMKITQFCENSCVQLIKLVIENLL